MDRGGIETWLLQALRKIDRRRLAIDIGVTKPGEGIYDSEVRQLGSKLFSLPHPKQPWQFAANLQDVLHKQGPYDVVHSHCYLYSGVVLKVAAKSGVPMRIAHVHPHVDVHEKRRFRSIYRRLMTRWISRFATQVLAPSRHSLDSFRDICDCRHIATSVLYNGVELERFSVSVDEQAVRRKQRVGLGKRS